MRLDPRILQDLAVAFTPKDYVRVTPLLFAATPLGMGYGETRFASPVDAFKVLYLAQTLTTSIAEAVIRDRFQDRVHRRVPETELALWGATSVGAARPLQLVDLRTTGLMRLGVSTEAARGKVQTQGRKLSQAIYEQTDADGMLYASRLTAAPCLCIFDRATSALKASPVTPLITQADLVAALTALNVTLQPGA